MSMIASVRSAQRLRDAAVERVALDIAGARHEVLPPRMTGVEAGSLLLSMRRAPP